jgi:TolA-binding protein
LGQVESAIAQIELLLEVPDQPEAKRLAWLTLIAGWQLQFLHDEAAANATLTRLVTEFPNTPQAFAAQRRLSLARAEAAARKT